jgi:prophage antirepressor-like protein
MPELESVISFEFDDQFIRVLRDENREPWFNANEICNVLGFANPHDAVARHVDEDDLGKREVIDGIGRKQMANHVNESGLYALIFGSTKPEAKRFKRWVTHEVLPAIRRTGAYVVPAQTGQGVFSSNPNHVADVMVSSIRRRGSKS